MTKTERQRQKLIYEIIAHAGKVWEWSIVGCIRISDMERIAEKVAKLKKLGGCK
jgi:hypothetical protein